jgi:hypothetical protein
MQIFVSDDEESKRPRPSAKKPASSCQAPIIFTETSCWSQPQPQKSRKKALKEIEAKMIFTIVCLSLKISSS